MKGPAMNTIANYLSPEDISLDVDVANKHELFEIVGRQMEREHALPLKSIALGLSRREQVGSTGLGQGVAIPHTRVPHLNRMLVAYLRLKSAIRFDAPDGEPVADVVVLLAPKQAAEEHLKVLADAAGMFADRDFRAHLQQCRDAVEVKQLFNAWPTIAAITPATNSTGIFIHRRET
jgi:PTS system nitrogen regulatory IIA component